MILGPSFLRNLDPSHQTSLSFFITFARSFALHFDSGPKILFEKFIASTWTSLCGLYVEVFTSMDGLVFGRLENFLKNEEYNTIPKANMKWKEQPVVWVEVFRISAWAFFAGSTCLCKKNGIHFYLHQECSTPLTCPAIPTKKLWCLPFQGISNPPKLKY